MLEYTHVAAIESTLFRCHLEVGVVVTIVLRELRNVIGVETLIKFIREFETLTKNALEPTLYDLSIRYPVP